MARILRQSEPKNLWCGTPNYAMNEEETLSRIFEDDAGERSPASSRLRGSIMQLQGTLRETSAQVRVLKGHRFRRAARRNRKELGFSPRGNVNN
jgi:hypothetical protein